MFKNYLKIAFRNIQKNRAFAFINVLGLAIGISACLIIFTVTRFELSFNQFHTNKKSIYRIVTEMQNNTGQKNYMSTIPDPASKVIRATVSGLDAVAMFHLIDSKVAIPEGDKIVKRFFPPDPGQEPSKIVLAEPQYFSVFSYDWLEGNKLTALNEPFRVVISENQAQKYFGSIPLDQIMGRQIIYDDSLRLTVTGIVRDWKQNSDLNFTDFISFSTVEHSYLKDAGSWDNWGGWNGSTQVFAKLAEGTTPERVTPQFAKIIKDNLTHLGDNKASFLLQPLAELHFDGKYPDSYSRKAHLPTLFGLMAIALFILIIAAINFINLSTAQSIRRAKEIGIRKVLGSSRRGIVFQFLFEISLLTLIAVALSMLAIKPVISMFHNLLPPGLNPDFFNLSALVFLVLLVITTSLLAGFYPAKVLSGYLPVISLKGDAPKQAGRGNLFRKGLIVFQFTISLLFIIATLVIGQQIHFMMNQDMGFTKDAIININTNWRYPPEKVKVLADRLRNISGVTMVSRNDGPPANIWHNGTAITLNKTEVPTQVLGSDEHYASLYQLHFIAGRNAIPADTINELVINEHCSKLLGFKKPEDALGTLVDFGWSNGPANVKRPIVGVVADFHTQSLHDPIPAVTMITEQGSMVGLKLSSQNLQPKEFQTLIDKISAAWKSVYPNDPFEYRFFDEQIAKFYDDYRKTNQIMNVAMCIAIFVSCMGLFGLATFTAEQRKKEIGIRKVLGATVSGIVTMLSKDFLKLVMLSLLIATPLAWYFMNDWLQGFAYRIQINILIFLLAGAMALLIAIFTVSFQAIKAALANPVKSLRSE
jgi:ABC-type lipoprotein release transport system permease subunit